MKVTRYQTRLEFVMVYDCFIPFFLHVFLQRCVLGLGLFAECKPLKTAAFFFVVTGVLEWVVYPALCCQFDDVRQISLYSVASFVSFMNHLKTGATLLYKLV